MNEQQLAAVKLALVALEEWYFGCGAGSESHDDAVEAIKQALAQDALDKMAENARELGLDCEPTVQEGRLWAVFCGGCRKEWSVPYQHPGKSICAECEAKCKDTPPAAQPAVQQGRDWSLLEATQESLREHMAEIKRLKAAQPAPVQEPYGYWWIPDGSVSGLKPEMSPNTGPHPNFTVIPLYTTPPAPQPVPVKTYHDGKPWPVQPKPWVGLSNEEVYEAAHYCVKSGQSVNETIRAIDAKLKGKNHG
jgi:hypothetical protein